MIYRESQNSKLKSQNQQNEDRIQFLLKTI